MKMKPNDLKKLETLIKKMFDGLGSSIEMDLEVYQGKGISDEQFRWNIFDAATVHQPSFVKKLYSYLDDNHIDTALRAITRTN